MDATKEVPDCIRWATEGYLWTPGSYGESGATLYRLDEDNRAGVEDESPLYLKYGVARIAEEITAEVVRLQWLARFLPVPEIRHFYRSVDHAWLLTTAISGQNAYDSLISDPDGRAQIVRALGEFLRRFHSLPILECPFNGDHELRLVDAKRNLEANRVNELDFDDVHAGWTAKQVWEEMQTLLPITFDRVVAHGDFSLGNIILQDRKVTGCIDVGRTGAADRYQDLAILWNNLAEFGGALQAIFLEAYGIERPDQRRLKFHLCLDEFF